jgi:hypothetical protein
MAATSNHYDLQMYLFSSPVFCPVLQIYMFPQPPYRISFWELSQAPKTQTIPNLILHCAFHLGRRINLYQKLGIPSIFPLTSSPYPTHHQSYLLNTPEPNCLVHLDSTIITQANSVSKEATATTQPALPVASPASPTLPPHSVLRVQHGKMTTSFWAAQCMPLVSG